MSTQEASSFTLRFQLVPFLIGTGLSVVLCTGALIFFNPFERDGTRTTSTPEDLESDIPRSFKPVEDSDITKSNNEPEASTNLVSIFELSTHFESSVALDDMLKNANLSQLVDLLDQSHNLQGVERLQSTQEQIFRKFATVDPIQALSHTQSFPKIQYEYFASLIYRDWSSFDLDAALTYADQHVPTLSAEGKNAILEQIFRAIWDHSDEAKLQIAARLKINPYTSKALLKKIKRDKPIDNPAEAWKEVLSVKNFGDDERNQLLQIALVVIEKDGYAKFADLANSIQDRRIRTRLISSALFDRMQTDEIGTVFEQAVQLFHDTARPVLFELAENWCYLDPLSALNAMSNVPLDQLRKHLEELVIDNWIRLQPKEVLQQLELLPFEYREDALVEGIWSMSANHPKETIDYLDKVSDPQTQWNVMTNLLQNWAHADIEEAFTWFLDNPNMDIPKGNSRTVLLHSLLVRVTPETAPSLFKLALKYPVDESGASWEASIIGELAREDMTKARALLPQVRDGPRRINSYVSIGLVFFSQDQSMNSVIELAEELPEDDRTEFFGKLIPRLSPQVAYEQIDELPTPQAQAQAALKLIQKAAKFKNPFTDEQIDHLESFLTDKERNVLGLDSESPQQ